MYKKHIKRLIAIVLMTVIMLSLSGCRTKRTERMVGVEKASLFYNIVYDKYTKVMYAVSNGGYFTLLVDANGNPLLYKD